ncbi:MAG: HupE/UreJ family protein [Gammaproteobacteria bacterium]|nr:HupE/UreJ family protein [Gammaproteobacteria bacterium]
MFWLVLAITASTATRAHEVRPLIADLDISQPGQVTLRLSLNLEALIAEIGASHNDTDDSANVTTYRQLRRLPPEELQRQLMAFLPRLYQGARLEAAGQPLALRLSGIHIPEVGDLELARESILMLTAERPSSVTELIWSWDARFGDSVIRVTSSASDSAYSAYLRSGQPSAPIPLSGDVQPSSGKLFLNYLAVGFTHILPKGLDHILFVIGLFLLNARFKPLLWQVSAFTLAHTLTLALGIYGVIRISPAVVEPLIAASIVYVCLENLHSDRMSRWRPLVVFAFGLLHGLGFAGVLLEIGLNPSYFATGLIAFNLGVELGQLVVIGGCFLSVGLWFRDKPWYRRLITTPASILIALVGSYWFLERVIAP